ncbi:MAG: autotransporter assembly complex protein TamA [Wigglesworthia glossinidia]|nr:autotransporter assembly complex protein TamA [Wigglesworthia glossinidia]
MFFRIYNICIFIIFNFFIFFSIIFTCYSNQIILNINSPSKNIYSKLQKCIKKNDITNFDTIEFNSKIKKKIETCLKILGYYTPQIEINFFNAVNKKNSILIINIKLGCSTKIFDTQIILDGEAKQDEDYLSWIKNHVPKLGEQLSHSEYDFFKQGLSDIAVKKGYFDAIFKISELQIFPQYCRARWYIIFNSGSRYRFGKIKFYGSQINLKYLENITKKYFYRFYDLDVLSDLTNQLALTNWFKSITVFPNFSYFNKSKNIISLDTILIPTAKNKLEIALGYSANKRWHIKGNWEKPWMSSFGHSMKTDLNISLYEKTINISYKMPIVANPLSDYYLLKVKIKHFSLNNFISNLIIFTAAKYWSINNFQAATDIHWILDNSIQNNHKNKKKILIYPGLQIKRIHKDPNIFPMFGISQNYKLNISSNFWGSNVDFILLRAENILINNFMLKHRYVIRNKFGWIITNSFIKIPISMRFFAGGDRSIRGFKYQSLSFRNSDNNIIGSLKLFTLSLEYQFNFYKNLWSSVFIDSGDANNYLKYHNLKTGIGCGIRWISQFGPIKIDIAKPIFASKNDRLEFYIGLGSEL